MVMFRYCQISQPSSESALDEAAAAVCPGTDSAVTRFCYNHFMRLLSDCMQEIEVKKSRFLCYLHRTESEEDARAFIRQIRKEHPQARHVCTGMIIDGLRRSSDDGEPSGTAGRPILSVLEGADMDHVCAAVVRYFGGTLLGTGGLVRAYSDAVKTALDAAVLGEARKMRRYTLTVPYSLSGRIENWLMQTGDILDTRYDQAVTYEFLVPEPVEDLVAEMTSGRCQALFLGEEVTEI